MISLPVPPVLIDDPRKDILALHQYLEQLQQSLTQASEFAVLADSIDQTYEAPLMLSEPSREDIPAFEYAIPGPKGDQGERGIQGPQGFEAPSDEAMAVIEIPLPGVRGPQGLPGVSCLPFYEPEELYEPHLLGVPQWQAWPVGSIFLSIVSTNPATLLGYGIWSAIAAGRVLVGLNSGDTDFDTPEKTGGAKTHTLTTSEIPAHTHNVGSANVDLPMGIGSNYVGSTNTVISGSTGGGAAHNNLQPYYVCYMWKRTS